ncbi:MAG: recombinase-like helix-turn-helix domain-containing protein [Rhodospirillaceae bacterium]
MAMEQESRIREPENRVWQTRTHPQTEFERQLADAIERAFSDGVMDLDGIVGRLNADGLRDEDNRHWTNESYCAAMARLGA